LVIAFVFWSHSTIAANMKKIRRVLVIYEAGLSYPGVASVDRAIREALNKSPYQIEPYTENLEEILFSDEASQRQFRRAFVGPGPVGGDVFSLAAQGRVAADMALRILKGARPQDVPAVKLANIYLFDWRALQGWKLEASKLPIGSVVLYREPTLRERGRNYFLAAAAVIIVQALLLFGLFWQRARKRKAEAILRDSEERFRLAAQAGKMFAYEWDAATDTIHRSPEFVQVLGFDEAAQTTGRQILAQVHAADREKVVAAFAELSPEQPSLRISFRMVRADGTTIWVERSSRAQFSKQGRLLRIVGMVADITERKLAEEKLHESEESFRLIANSAPVLIWMSGPDKLCTYFNQPWLRFTGRSIHQELGNGWAEGVHAEDLEHCLETYKQTFDRREPFEMEYRLRRHDGKYRWIFDYGVPRFNADGSFAGYIGSASDMTDQKLAREALEQVSWQLIEAQEKERRRLARELHDDICQRLAMISLKIEKATRATTKLDVSVAEQLEQIWQQCSNLTGDVQALSHELHPSILDNLGLVTAVRSFCREVSAQNGVVVEFVGRDVPDSLPREVSLSLFRVVQEALHNAVKYSGQKHFEVRLQGESERLELEVSDQGVGFDAPNAKNGRGLGLVSMAERINQVNGTFTIDSQPNTGTRIRACVPLTPQKVRAASAS
jgi:PAS domain S-box-containing protein